MSGNKNIVLVMGKPSSGKSASLMKLPHSRWAYLNTDLKELPFYGQFAANAEVSDAMQIFDYITEIENQPAVDGGVLDTVTFLMDMYERQYVQGAANTQKAWGDYATFFKSFIHAIKAGSKDYAILAHEDSFLNEQTMQMESRVPVKGSVGKTGVEAHFTTVLAAKQMQVSKLEGHDNDLLHITDDEREDGIKYVFQTRITKETAGEKIRAPMGLWARDELYIDNDLSQVFARLKEFFGKPVEAAA